MQTLSRLKILLSLRRSGHIADDLEILYRRSGHIADDLDILYRTQTWNLLKGASNSVICYGTTCSRIGPYTSIMGVPHDIPLICQSGVEGCIHSLIKVDSNLMNVRINNWQCILKYLLMVQFGSWGDKQNCTRQKKKPAKRMNMEVEICRGELISNRIATLNRDNSSNHSGSES